MSKYSKNCDRMGLCIQFICGGLLGALSGLMFVVSRSNEPWVQMPYSPYFLAATFLLLAGLAMLYGDRFWSADHILPHRKPKHSRWSQLLSIIIVTLGAVLAVSMLVCSMAASDEDEMPDRIPNFNALDSRDEALKY